MAKGRSSPMVYVSVTSVVVQELTTTMILMDDG